MNIVCPVCNNPVDSQAVSCPTCGFKLLGTTQRFRPLTFTENSFSAVVKPCTSALLHVARGPQTGVDFPLKNTSLSIGRSPQCDIFLNDMTVSRRHALIEPSEGNYVIRDTNSFNGLWVNNVSVNAHVLQNGDIVQIGSFCLVYKEE